MRARRDTHQAAKVILKPSPASAIMKNSGSVAVTPTSPTSPTSSTSERPGANSTAPRLDGLTSAEREDLVNEAEWGFRTWLRETGPQMGYVLYPSTRQILKSLHTLYALLDAIDFSDIAL
ncbi:hypothetical protein LPJ64_001840 [Coemansia asiatica]|uniref:Uncharacterized protein n=1 Tax=Coemansia asiatica TaxID=1052880 RepID=A0A9W8CJM0_9FUNG|nr:hypothetical protein LPJ64_001840 [Coemansia asiatica]